MNEMLLIRVTSVFSKKASSADIQEGLGKFVLAVPQRRKPGKKRVYTTTVAPLLSRSVTRPQGHRAETAMMYTILLGKQGKWVYTIGLERRVYTIEASDPEKEKRRASTVVVYTFFLPWKDHYASRAFPENIQKIRQTSKHQNNTFLMQSVLGVLRTLDV